jgi:tetratricopeptide (TPR) repeat protein
LPAELERRQLSLDYAALPLATGGEDGRGTSTADAQEPAASPDELAIMGSALLPPKDNTEELGRFRGRLREAILRHPGEAFFPLLGSLVAMRTGVGNALTWIGRALELAPTNGPVHLVLAELMQSHGATAQAMLHLRLAAQYDHTLAGAVSVRAPVWAPSIDALMQAIPNGHYGDGVLLEACARVKAIEPKLDCFRRAATRSPDFLQAQLQFAQALLAAIQSRQAPCADEQVERCTAEAEVAIRLAGRLDPKAWRPRYLLSKVLLARGDTPGAAKLLTRTCPSDFEGDDCWHEALAMAIKVGATDTIATAANALGARPCDGMESCSTLFTSLATELEAAGQHALACKFFVKAAEANPSADRWLKVAEVASQAHLNGVARAALDRANRSFDASASTRAHVEELRQRVARTTVSPP